MKKFFVLIAIAVFFSLSSAFAEEYNLTFHKPTEGNSATLYVNGHEIFIWHDEHFDGLYYHYGEEYNVYSGVEFFFDEEKGPITFSVSCDGCCHDEKNPKKITAIFFLNLDSFSFYEAGDKFNIILVD
jgi:hypothetical protein